MPPRDFSRTTHMPVRFLCAPERAIRDVTHTSTEHRAFEPLRRSSGRTFLRNATRCGRPVEPCAAYARDDDGERREGKISRLEPFWPRVARRDYRGNPKAWKDQMLRYRSQWSAIRAQCRHERKDTRHKSVEEDRGAENRFRERRYVLETVNMTECHVRHNGGHFGKRNEQQKIFRPRAPIVHPNKVEIERLAGRGLYTLNHTVKE